MFNNKWSPASPLHFRSIKINLNLVRGSLVIFIFFLLFNACALFGLACHNQSKKSLFQLVDRDSDGVDGSFGLFYLGYYNFLLILCPSLYEVSMCLVLMGNAIDDDKKLKVWSWLCCCYCMVVNQAPYPYNFKKGSPRHSSLACSLCLLAFSLYLLRFYCVSVSCCWTILKVNQIKRRSVWLKFGNCDYVRNKTIWCQCMMDRSPNHCFTVCRWVSVNAYMIQSDHKKWLEKKSKETRRERKDIKEKEREKGVCEKIEKWKDDDANNQTIWCHCMIDRSPNHCTMVCRWVSVNANGIQSSHKQWLKKKSQENNKERKDVEEKGKEEEVERKKIGRRNNEVGRAIVCLSIYFPRISSISITPPNVLVYCCCCILICCVVVLDYNQAHFV